MEKQNEIEALEARLKTLKAGNETPVTNTSNDTGYLDFPPTPEEIKEYQKERRWYDNARIITPDFMVDEDTTLEEFVRDSRARKKMLQDMNNALGERVPDDIDRRTAAKTRAAEKVTPEPVQESLPVVNREPLDKARLDRWAQIQLEKLNKGIYKK